MIIVEGMDNTGKSTLLNRLAEDLRLVQVRNNIPHPQSLDDIEQYLLGIASLDYRVRGRVICDRWPSISEAIYGPAIRDRNIIPQGLRSYLIPVGALVIFCRPPNQNILNFGDREQMEGVIERGLSIIEAYDREMVLVGGFVPVLAYDYTVDDYEPIRNAVLTHLKELR